MDALRRIAVLPLVLSFLAPRIAGGTPFREGAAVFDLGGGRQATRVVSFVRRHGVRIEWSVVGFVQPAEQVVAFASAGARLLALSDPSGVLYSDDGANWRVARLDGTLSHPVAISMSPSVGALVSEVSGVWVSFNRGETWRQIRDRTARALDDVAVVGTQVVYADDRGGVWVVDAASSVFRTLCDSGVSAGAALAAESDGSVSVRGGDRCMWRVDSSGATVVR